MTVWWGWGKPCEPKQAAQTFCPMTQSGKPKIEERGDLKIGHNNRYTWKRLNPSFHSALHRTSLKNTNKSYVPSCTAKLFIFRSHYSLRTILLPLKCFKRHMGAMWYVRLMILNLAILKMEYNPNFLPMGLKQSSCCATVWKHHYNCSNALQ